MWVSSSVLLLQLVPIRISQVPYPLISLVSRLPQTLHGQCPLAFHTRTFESFSLLFGKEGEAIDVFESVKELTVASTLSAVIVTRTCNTYVVCQHQLTASMHSSTFLARLSPPRMAGRCIHQGKNLAEWGLALERKRGGSQTSIEIILCVPLM
jgi:hypothetical protein